MSLVVLLIHFMPKSNTAVAWSSIARTFHSSVWPTILNTDSNSSPGPHWITNALSKLTTVNSILAAVCGIVLPLGFKEGPLVSTTGRKVDALYIADQSALGRATTLYRDRFSFGRSCGGRSRPIPCTGTEKDAGITPLSSNIIDIFRSTSHSPFTIQYRQFFNTNTSFTSGFLSTPQSVILRNDTFIAEGVVVDMSSENPGIGFWNHTLPNLPNGGTWSQDVLWLEPATECVSTNLTIDHTYPEDLLYNITDHGGFFNTTQEFHSPLLEGQKPNLAQIARHFAVRKTIEIMKLFNLTHVPKRPGKSFHVNLHMWYTSREFLDMSFEETVVRLTQSDTFPNACRVIFPNTTADMSNIHLTCGLFFGYPSRLDGGDIDFLDVGAQLSHELVACASATKASVQRVTFSSKNATDLASVRVTRKTAGIVPLWAVENTNMSVVDVTPVWGRVDDIYRDNPSVSTIRSKFLYLPTGGGTLYDVDTVMDAGQPYADHSRMWQIAHGFTSFGSRSIVDYIGGTNFAMAMKFQNMLKGGATLGNARIRNIIWTDLMVNNLVGTRSNSSVMASPYAKSLEYNIKFAIPAFILLAIWTPSILGALYFLVGRTITLGYVKQVFNHTSVGRVVLGSSALQAEDQVVEPPVSEESAQSREDVTNNYEWAKTLGTTRVVLDLDQRDDGENGSTEKLIA